MLQLTYISSRRDVGKDDVEKILSAARRNNARDRITGLLVHDGRRFLQALEGDAELVERCFARISQDDRHRAVVRLSQCEVTVRGFGDWAMAYHAGGVAGDKASMIEAVDALTASISDANMRELFRSFARVERRTA